MKDRLRDQYTNANKERKLHKKKSIGDLYKIAKKLCGKKRKANMPERNKQDTLTITSDKE